MRREVELVHLQLSKLLKSIVYGYRHDFWNGETSKCGSDRDRQTQPCSFSRLPFVISLCVWSLERASGISDECFCTLTEPKGDDKICWRGFREEYATKYWAGLQCLVFPPNLSLSAPKRCSVSCGSISYKTQPNHSPVGLLGQMLHVHPYGMLKYVLMFHRLFT